MSSNRHIYLILCVVSSFLVNSMTIFEENSYSIRNIDIQESAKVNNLPLERNSEVKNEFHRSFQGKRILQGDFTDLPSNKPESFDIQEKISSKIQNLNFQGFSRTEDDLPSHFDDEKDIIYTSDLHIFSALGIEGESKKMAYIKSNIEGNRKMIFQHNYSKKKPYRLAENKFIIYTAQEFKEMYLTLRQPSDSNSNSNRQISVISPKINIRSLQASENLTINWKTAKKMTSVKFQQTCGACYSFTPIGTIQSAYMIFKNTTLNLAEQQVVDCSSAYNNYGCIGGWNAHSYKYIKDFGLAHESDYPYKADVGSCQIAQDSLKYNIKSFVEVPNDCNKVIEALKIQPLSIAVNSEGWIYYSSGVFSDCKSGASNHGVILAGVDQKTWLIKNSWGFTWGENGYMRISKEALNNACNVCRWASYPVL